MTATLRARIQQLAERIDALELRERVLLLGAVVVVLFMVIDALALQPALKAQQLREQHISELEMKLSALRTQAGLLSARSGEDSVHGRQQQREALAEQLAELDAKITGQLGALVEPAQAAELLKQVVARHKGLTIASLEASSQALDDPDLERGGDLGRYQLDLALEGGYLDLLRYLEALEGMPWKFFWQNVDFQVATHPRALTRMQIYTLGGRHG